MTAKMVGNYSTYLFTIIFWILHSSFSFLDYLLATINKCIIKIQLKFTGQKFLDIQEVKKLSKVPKHIAFMVLEDQLSYGDLANLVIWCIAVEINNISLFDIHGCMKSNQEVLLTEIKSKYSELSVKNETPFMLNWIPHNDSTERSSEQAVIVNINGAMYPDSNGNGSAVVIGNGKKGNPETQKFVNISLLGPEDGKQDIVLAAKSIGLKVHEMEIGVDDINEDFVGATLRSNKNIPDPCLLVRLGRIASNVDFLPWQIRLSEIHSIPSHHQATSAQLLQILQKFGSCSQRFGK